MYNMNTLFMKGEEVGSDDVVDAYTNLAYVYKLPHYKILTLASLIGGKKKLARGVDVPDYAFDFIAEQGRCLGIANYMLGKVDYIILKSLKEKKFLTAGDKRSIPYGLGLFNRNFQYGDWVVIVEGLKDRDSLARIYPNVIATQTAGMGSILKEVVLTLTNRFILMYDNMEIDDTGKKAFYRDKKFLVDRNCQVVLGTHPPKVKDTGEMADTLYKCEYFQNSFLNNYYEMQLRSIIGEWEVVQLC